MEEVKTEEINEKVRRFDELYSEYEKQKAIADEHLGAKDIVEDLASRGKIIIEEGGNILVPGQDQIPVQQVESAID